jgi:ABC-2 type transport system permease protein
MHAAWVIWLRQIKRYSRARTRIVGALGQPILFLLALGFGFGPIYERAGRGDYVEFLAPGIVAMGIVLNAVFSGAEVIWDRNFGFLKETLVAPVPRFFIVLGRTLGSATTALLHGIVVLVICVVIGFRVHNLETMPLAFVFMFMIALIFSSLGTAIGSALRDIHAFPLIVNFIIMPIFFFSNALFPVSQNPLVFRTIVRANPLSYAVSGMRDALTGCVSSAIFWELGMLVALSILLMTVASFLFSRMEV